MTEPDENLRDLFAALAMHAMMSHSRYTHQEIIEESWLVADAMVMARNPKEEGLTALHRHVPK